jgi:RNA polymerase sigma-70 factor, ECF subfamily
VGKRRMLPHRCSLLSHFAASGIISYVNSSTEVTMRFRAGSTPELVEARSGSGAAVEESFLSCERRLGKYLVQMVGDRTLAEDLLQDTFHDAFRARAHFSEVRNPEAWLFGIARHLALASLRRRRRFERVFDRLTRRVDAELFDRDVLQLRDLLERHLVPEDRSLLLLRYLHGFGAIELAEMTGLTPAAVRQRLSRARATLVAAATPVTNPDDKKEGG